MWVCVWECEKEKEKNNNNKKTLTYYILNNNNLTVKRIKLPDWHVFIN